MRAGRFIFPFFSFLSRRSILPLQQGPAPGCFRGINGYAYHVAFTRPGGQRGSRQGTILPSSSSTTARSPFKTVDHITHIPYLLLLLF